MKTKDTKFPLWVWIGFLLILTLCVPWYLDGEWATQNTFWAFPLWGWIIVGHYLLLAIYTAFIYLKVWKT